MRKLYFDCNNRNQGVGYHQRFYYPKSNLWTQGISINKKSLLDGVKQKFHFGSPPLRFPMGTVEGNDHDSLYDVQSLLYRYGKKVFLGAQGLGKETFQKEMYIPVIVTYRVMMPKIREPELPKMLLEITTINNQDMRLVGKKLRLPFPEGHRITHYEQWVMDLELGNYDLFGLTIEERRLKDIVRSYELEDKIRIIQTKPTSNDIVPLENYDSKSYFLRIPVTAGLEVTQEDNDDTSIQVPYSALVTYKTIHQKADPKKNTELIADFVGFDQEEIISTIKDFGLPLELRVSTGPGDLTAAWSRPSA